MSVSLWIFFIAASVCVSYAATENINPDTVQDILRELKSFKFSNELRDQKIEHLERQARDNRRTYEQQFERQASRIAELELQLSEMQKANNPKPVANDGKAEEHQTAYGSAFPSNKRIRQVGSPGVAFTAYLSKHASNLGHEHTIPFDSVILNEGQAFNTNTHEFTCPMTGVYSFQTALLSQSQDISITEIVKEGVQLVQAHAESRNSGAGTYDQGFNSVVTKCIKGESVWVRNFQHFGSTAYSERYTTFTGCLLWETEEPVAVG